MRTPYFHLQELTKQGTNRFNYIEAEAKRIAKTFDGKSYAEHLDLSLRRDLGPLGLRREKNIYLTMGEPPFMTYVAHADHRGGGVIDNGTGVAALLYFAELYGRERFGDRGVRIVFTSGEEGSQRTYLGIVSNALFSNLVILGLPFNYWVNMILAGLIQKSDSFRFGLRGARQDVKILRDSGKYKQAEVLAVDSLVGEHILPWSMSDATLLGLFLPVYSDPELNKRLARAYEINGRGVCHTHLAIGSTDAAPYIESGIRSTAMVSLGKISYHTEGDSMEVVDFQDLQNSVNVLVDFHQGVRDLVSSRRPYKCIRIFNGKDGINVAGSFTSACGNEIVEIRKGNMNDGNVYLGSQTDWAPVPLTRIRQVFDLGSDITPSSIFVEGVEYIRNGIGTGKLVETMASRNGLGVLALSTSLFASAVSISLEMLKYVDNPYMLALGAMGGISLGALSSSTGFFAALRYQVEMQKLMNKAIEMAEICGWGRPVLPTLF